MRLQFADPSDHPLVGSLPFSVDLEAWDLPHMHGVLGLHRHVVRLVELGEEGHRVSYVVKELPDHLVQREYRLLRSLAEDHLPTVLVVAGITERTGGRDGLLITRHLGVDAELAMRAAAGKFRRRFEAVEVLAAERGVDVAAADLATLDALWDEVKTTELH